jgi:hypothetical protein
MRALRWLIPIAVLAGLGYLTVKSWPSLYRTEPRPPLRIPACSIRVQVLNASNNAQAGQQVHEYLSRQGFDVYEDKPASEILPRTRIIDRRDPSGRFARAVQGFLTIPGRRLGPIAVKRAVRPEVGSVVDSLLFLEVTVRLGEDYRTFFAVQDRPF